MTFFDPFRPLWADFSYTADKRQPKIVAIRVKLYAAKVKIVCALTFARLTKRALRRPPMVLLQPKISSTNLRFFKLTV